ncbi:MAG: DUF4259 domain-containing protein [Hyphomonadaceae bacterium]
MGAWSHRSFDNDDALDFIEEVEADGEPAVANAFEVVNHLGADDYLEAPDASVAVAAAELVAAALGKPLAGLPDEARALVPKIRTQKTLRGPALKAVTRVLEDSELLGLWKESKDFEPWRESVSDLIGRLS